MQALTQKTVRAQREILPCQFLLLKIGCNLTKPAKDERKVPLKPGYTFLKQDVIHPYNILTIGRDCVLRGYFSAPPSRMVEEL